MAAKLRLFPQISKDIRDIYPFVSVSQRATSLKEPARRKPQRACEAGYTSGASGAFERGLPTVAGWAHRGADPLCAPPGVTVCTCRGFR